MSADNCCELNYFIKKDFHHIWSDDEAAPPSSDSFELLDNGSKELLDDGSFELLD